MSLSPPSTQAVADNIVAQLEASLSQTIPLLPKAFTRVLAKVLAGVVVILYKYGGFSFLQMFVAHATMDETVVNGKTIKPLVEWGRLIGVGDPILATRAELSVTIAVKTIGAPALPAGQQLLKSETGVVYQTVTVLPLDANPVTVTVRATSDQDDGGGAGTIGNLSAGDTIAIANAPGSIDSTATVVAQVVTGADAESVDKYRARIVKRFQQRPQGGAFADYRIWAEDVPGIINAYPYKGSPGEVNVYVEADEASSGNPDGIPTGPQLTAVADAIEIDVAGVATRRPVNAAVSVLPITRQAIDVAIAGLDLSNSSSDEATVKEEIRAGLDEHMRSREPFIVGLSVLPRDDRITVSALGGIVDGIVSAAGGTVTTVGFTVGGITFTAITLGQGEKAKLGTPSYT